MPCSFPKLFITDLDGTALGGGFQPYARLPDFFSDFLDRLDARGCRWAINTTWDVEGQSQLVFASSVKSRPAFLVGEFGLRLATLNGETPEFVQPYTQNNEDVLADIRQQKLWPLGQALCSRFNAEKVMFYGHLLSFFPTADEAESVGHFLAENPEITDGLILMRNPDQGHFSAYPSFLKKGHGLGEILRLADIAPGNVVVAGDELMDVSMMRPELAQYAVCPNNANSAVKEHVLAMDGVVGEHSCGKGVCDAFAALSKRHGWDFE